MLLSHACVCVCSMTAYGQVRVNDDGKLSMGQTKRQYGSLQINKAGRANGIALWGNGPTFRIYQSTWNDNNEVFITRGGNQNRGLRMGSSGNLILRTNRTTNYYNHFIVHVPNSLGKAIVVSNDRTNPWQTHTFRVRGNGRVYATRYYTTSDQRSKKDINNQKPREDFQKLYNLEAVSYRFDNTTATSEESKDGDYIKKYKTETDFSSDYKNEEFEEEEVIEEAPIQYEQDTTLSYGFIAQDMRKIFPELVDEDENGELSINYVGIIPLLVEALKEQQQQIAELKDAVKHPGRRQNQNNQNNKDKNTGNKSGSIGFNNASSFDQYSQLPELHQNSPNPFNRETRINYYLPDEVSSATLYIYNMQGNQIKNYRLSVRGNASHTIHASELEPGMYLYTLIADGKEVSTKRMVLTE